jgi:hypothetical protein
MRGGGRCRKAEKQQHRNDGSCGDEAAVVATCGSPAFNGPSS